MEVELPVELQQRILHEANMLPISYRLRHKVPPRRVTYPAIAPCGVLKALRTFDTLADDLVWDETDDVNATTFLDMARIRDGDVWHRFEKYTATDLGEYRHDLGLYDSQCHAELHKQAEDDERERWEDDREICLMVEDYDGNM